MKSMALLSSGIELGFTSEISDHCTYAVVIFRSVRCQDVELNESPAVSSRKAVDFMRGSLVNRNSTLRVSTTEFEMSKVL